MRVNHPTNPNVSKNVPDELVEKWLENGWTEAKPAKAAPVKKAASKKADKPDPTA